MDNEVTNVPIEIRIERLIRERDAERDAAKDAEITRLNTDLNQAILDRDVAWADIAVYRVQIARLTRERDAADASEYVLHSDYLALAEAARLIAELAKAEFQLRVCMERDKRTYYRLRDEAYNTVLKNPIAKAIYEGGAS